MAKYDEDLHDNPFFIAFQEKHSDLFTLAADNCWMVRPRPYIPHPCAILCIYTGMHTKDRDVISYEAKSK